MFSVLTEGLSAFLAVRIWTFTFAWTTEVYSSDNKLLRSHTRMHAHTHWDTAKVHSTLKYSHTHACLQTPRHMPTPTHKLAHMCLSTHMHTHTIAIPWGYHEQELFFNQLCGSYSWTKTYCENGRSEHSERTEEEHSRLVQLPDFGIGTGQLGRIVPNIYFFPVQYCFHHIIVILAGNISWWYWLVIKVGYIGW